MTGQMRFSKQAETGHATGPWKLMPTRLLYYVQGHAFNQAVEQVPQFLAVAQGFLVTTVSFDDPFAA